MSYSFSITAATKAAASEAIKSKLGEIVASQPVHEADRAQAQAAADAFISILPDDGRELSILVNGWLSSDGTQHTGVSFGITANKKG